MILQVELENFYSVRDRQTFDLCVPATTPDDDRFAKLKFDDSLRVCKVCTILGPNASGKTTFLRAISFLTSFMTRSFEAYKLGETISIDPFQSGKHRKSPIALAIEFTPGPSNSGMHNLYRYEIEISFVNDVHVVESEALHFGKKLGKLKPLFERKRQGDKYKITAHESFGLSEEDPRKDVRNNVSLISSLAQFNHEESVKISKMINSTFYTNISINKFSFPDNFATEYLKNRPFALSELKKVLSRIDVGIEDFDIIEVDGKDVPIFHHSGLDGVTTLFYESEGTRNFYRLFPFIIAAMRSGSMAIIDEIDSDLHPALVSEILSWFQSNSESNQEAQIITTLNHPSTLRQMEKEEVFLVEKSSDGVSRISRLSDFEGIRRDTNLYSKYMSGALGAFPSFG